MDVIPLLQLAFQPDGGIAAVVDTDPVLFPVIDPGHFVVIGAVPVIVKIETTDGIQAAHCMGIPLHDGLESFLLCLAVPEGKIVFPFVAEEAVGGVFAGNRFIRLHRKYLPQLCRLPGHRSIWCHKFFGIPQHNNQMRFVTYLIH